MGRQIQICTTDYDNKVFECYLKENFDCIFFQTSAPSIEEIIIESFDKTSKAFNTKIVIWNKQFPWVQKYGQTKTKDSYYLSNESNAPVIEFSKTDWSRNGHGRIYWTKYFTSGPITYDLIEFEKFYNSVIGWFKKNSKGKIKWADVNIYYLEDAWNQYLQKSR
jgi:hypothetical protein